MATILWKFKEYFKVTNMLLVTPSRQRGWLITQKFRSGSSLPDRFPPLFTVVHSTSVLDMGKDDWVNSGRFDSVNKYVGFSLTLFPFVPHVYLLFVRCHWKFIWLRPTRAVRFNINCGCLRIYNRIYNISGVNIRL